jgi:hypothetical protein
MPPTPEMIENALEILRQSRLNSFTASPTTVRPGVASTLNWSVTAPAGVVVTLNNSTVAKAGSRAVEPATTTVYRLVAKMSTVQQTLGTVTVAVDQSQCVVHSMDEETVRQLLRSNIDAALAGSPLSQRSAATVEIDRNGIAVRLRLKVDVPNFFDPNLNINLVIGVGVVSNNVSLSYRSYSNDLDWPWWVTGITLGVTKIIEEIIENKIERQVKPQLLQKLKERIDVVLQLIPGTYRLHSLTTEADEIRAMICPVA